MSSRVLLSPRWLVAHVVILAVVITFPLLARWQFERYQEERDAAARLEARLADDPQPLTAVLRPAVDDATAGDLEYTVVTATGTYALDEQVFHRNRDFGGQAGFDVLTPLVLDDGTGVLVRRGFVPPVRAGAADPGGAPGHEGEVTVTGYLERSGAQPGFGPRDPAEGVLATVFHADVARIDQQTSAPLLPMVLHLTAQEPPPGAADPRPQPAPSIDASSNLNYAFQWLAFTVIAVVGYGIVLWRVRRGVHPTGPTPAAPQR